MSKKRKKNDTPLMRLRLQPEVQEQLEQAVRFRNCTLTAEINRRLMLSFNESNLLKLVEDTILGALQAHFTEIKGPTHGEVNGGTPEQARKLELRGPKTQLPDRGS